MVGAGVVGARVEFLPIPPSWPPLLPPTSLSWSSIVIFAVGANVTLGWSEATVPPAQSEWLGCHEVDGEMLLVGVGGCAAVGGAVRSNSSSGNDDNNDNGNDSMRRKDGAAFVIPVCRGCDSCDGFDGNWRLFVLAALSCRIFGAIRLSRQSPE